MCELLGLTFNEPVNASFSFRGFKERGRFNPHGWGLAYYGDSGLVIIKQPVNASTSDLASSLINTNYLSNTFIGHVRYASRGARVKVNTHPFSIDDYCFAHNGTVNTDSLRLINHEPVGDTDSEHVFCYLMDNFSFNDLAGLHELLKSINSHGSLNCLLTDGRFLACYNDVNNHNQGLKYVYRDPVIGSASLSDADLTVDLSGIKHPVEHGYVIASRALTNESWFDFRPGELIVFDRGRIVYQNGFVDDEYIRLMVIRAIKRSPHRVSIRDLSSLINIPVPNVIHSIGYWLDEGYLVKDSRDAGLDWRDSRATYYTNPVKRSIISELID